MDLSENVRHYYLQHFNKLPEDKQFHFASRLAAWNNDPECIEKLRHLRHYIIPSDEITAQQEMLSQLIQNPPAAKINAADERAPYFARYPELRGIMLALFKVRHAWFIYDVDLRSHLLTIKPIDKLHELADTLANDSEAIRVLSTYAINYIYLVERILFDDSGIINPDSIYKLADGYDTKKSDQLLLLIYLYTHCIIGESNFYQRGLQQNQSTYIKMLASLEQLIADNYNNVNLDNKLEFLVCCRIAKYESVLKSKIYDECEQSISPEGLFVIDTINNAGQSNKTSFADSEHRNVLFIMSCGSFQHA